MGNLSQEYLAAMARSFSNQEGGLTIPPEQAGEVVRIPMGSQPMGCAGRTLPDGRDQVAVMLYYEPAVMLITTHCDEGRHLQVEHIRGVDTQYEGESVRIFPGYPREADLNRGQTVTWGSDGSLWVSRNGEGDFFVLASPEETGGRWMLIGKYAIPGDEAVHAALLVEDVLHTVESSRSLDPPWQHVTYRFDGKALTERTAVAELPAWTYGFGRDNNGTLWTVADHRCKGTPSTGAQVPQSIRGNGVVFLEDGSALVSSYGQSAPGALNGAPGEIVFVPAHMFL